MSKEGCFQNSILEGVDYPFETGDSLSYFHHPHYQSQ